MKVVLRSDVEKVGNKGDIVTVSDGHARNYLIPRGHAIVATEGISAQAKAMRAARERTDAKAREEARIAGNALAKKVVGMTVRAGSEGKLFGSVTSADIATAINEQQGTSLEKRQVELSEPIKEIGTHDVAVKFHSEVIVNVKLELTAAE